MHFVRLALTALTVAICGQMALAKENLQEPQGPVVLTVTGVSDGVPEGIVAQFDLDSLAELGTAEFGTTTIWTDGHQHFEGTPLANVLARLGITHGTLRATAINDYSVEIPVSSVTSEAPLVAFRRNGKVMPLRDKGPLWLVYPFDSDKDYRTEVIYSRSIWQLDRIEAIR